MTAYVPLSFELGEAFQFDWSEEGLVVGGIYHRAQVAHLKLCASRAFWLVAYPSQGHEMLFDAHTRSFAALRNGAPFADMPEALERLRRGLLRQTGGDRVMAQVLAIVPAAGLEAVIVAAELAMERCPPSGRVSVEHVVNVLGRLNAPSAAPLSAETALQVATPPLANTARYDRLRGQEVDHA